MNLLTCLLAGLLPWLGLAQDERLTGRVVDGAGAPVAGAEVILGADRHTWTDDNGYFSFSRPDRTAVRITIRRTGYVPQTIAVPAEGWGDPMLIRLEVDMHMLDEVLILENRVRRKQQSESFNVELISRDFIHRHLGGSLMTTLERLPGVQAIGIGSGQSKPLIRGLGFNRLAVVDNGIKHEAQQWGADHGLELDQFAVDEVELIKGAASVRYGSDALAGVIEVKPAAAPAADTIRGDVTLLAKTNNGQYGASVNLGARRAAWFADGRVTYQRYGDYRVPTDTVHVYNYPVPLDDHRMRNTAGHESGLHLHVGYIGARVRSSVYVSNTNTRSGFFANAHGLEPRRVDTDLHDRSGRDIQLPSQAVNHFKAISRNAVDFGNRQLALDIGFQRNFRSEFNHYVNHGYMPAMYPDTLHIPRDLERQFDKQVFTANLRGLWTTGRHELTAGAGGEWQHNTTGGWGFLLPGFRQQTFGVYLYDKYQVAAHALLHAAVRYDYGALRSGVYRDWFPSGTGSERVYVVRADALTRHFNSFVWSVGLNLNSGPFSTKINLGKSFRMPIAKELAANGVNYHYFSYEQGDPHLSAEQSYQADVTFAWETDRWTVQLSPFYNYFPNYIYLNPTPEFDYLYGAGNQVFRYTQSRVVRYGGEASVHYRITPAVHGSVLAEYVYAEQRAGDRRGYTLPFSPPTSVLFSLDWSARSGKLLQQPYAAVDVRLVAAQDRIVPPERRTPGYHVVNARLGTGLSCGGRLLQWNVQVQNLLNAKYLNHTSFYRLIGLHEASRNVVVTLGLPLGR